MQRNLAGLDLCAAMMDGISFDSETFLVALGIGQDARKTVLGLRQGASENAAVASELCADLEQRGFDFQPTRLYVPDGAKARTAALKRLAVEAALIQRCQWHNRRNERICWRSTSRLWGRRWSRPGTCSATTRPGRLWKTSGSSRNGSTRARRGVWPSPAGLEQRERRGRLALVTPLDLLFNPRDYAPPGLELDLSTVNTECLPINLDRLFVLALRLSQPREVHQPGGELRVQESCRHGLEQFQHTEARSGRMQAQNFASLLELAGRQPA